MPVDCPDEPSVFCKLIDLYVFADRLAALDLKRDTIARIQEEYKRTEDLPSFEDVINAFDSLPPGSPLREWLVRHYAYDWDPCKDSVTDIALRERLPRDFLLQVMILSCERTAHHIDNDNDRYEDDICSYHQHEDIAEVEACRVRRKAQDNGTGGWLTSADFNAHPAADYNPLLERDSVDSSGTDT